MVLNGGGPRFRILEGGLRGGGGGGVKHFRWLYTDWSPAPNQCQNNYISQILTLKTDYKVKLRIELKSILLEIPSNKIKVHQIGTFVI